jgi:RNA polymerase sigma factor (sigma-70 family)
MWLFKSKKKMSDEALAKGYYTSGDKALMGLLFENHVKTVFGVCLFYFRDKDVAKDMVMQIFEKLMLELRKTEVNNFKAWLSFVVRNYCISELRKSKKHLFVNESYLDFEIKETDYEKEEKIRGVSDDVLLEQMSESLTELKPNQKLCVELFYLQNKSYQEISHETSFSVNEVKSHIQNGKRNLKLLIEAKNKNKRNAA